MPDEAVATLTPPPPTATPETAPKEFVLTIYLREDADGGDAVRVERGPGVGVGRGLKMLEMSRLNLHARALQDAGFLRRSGGLIK